MLTVNKQLGNGKLLLDYKGDDFAAVIQVIYEASWKPSSDPEGEGLLTIRLTENSLSMVLGGCQVAVGKTATDKFKAEIFQAVYDFEKGQLPPTFERLLEDFNEGYAAEDFEEQADVFNDAEQAAEDFEEQADVFNDAEQAAEDFNEAIEQDFKDPE